MVWSLHAVFEVRVLLQNHRWEDITSATNRGIKRRINSGITNVSSGSFSIDTDSITSAAAAVTPAANVNLLNRLLSKKPADALIKVCSHNPTHPSPSSPPHPPTYSPPQPPHPPTSSIRRTQLCTYYILQLSTSLLLGGTLRPHMLELCPLPQLLCPRPACGYLLSHSCIIHSHHPLRFLEIALCMIVIVIVIDTLDLTSSYLCRPL